jgi:TolB protein
MVNLSGSMPTSAIEAFRRALIATTCAAVLASPAAFGQEDPVFTVSVQGSHEFRLAVPPAAGSSDTASTVAETVRRDLDLSGYFTLLTDNVSDGGGVEPGSFSFPAWQSAHASALAKLRVLPGGTDGCDTGAGRICGDVYVYDTAGQKKLAGVRVRATPDNARAVGHELASAILKALVGEPGFFQGHLVAVGQKSGENKEIFVLDIDGRNVRPVTRNGSINLSPSWSADGNQIAWTSYKRGNPDVFVKDLRSGGVRTLSSRDGVNLSPAFSPDGTMVAVARSVNGETDIFLLNARTGEDIRQLTTGGGIDISPCFTPDGRTVVFSSERGGTASIHAVATNGGTPWRVTPFSGRFTDPMVSPDGQHVAFVVQHGAFDVWVVKLDGSGLIKITGGQGDNEDPSWSPDGRYLAFSSTRRGRSEIWLSTLNGQHQVPLTDSGGWTQPVWRP